MEINFGTLNSDNIFAPQNSWTFGLSGDDVLFSSTGPGANNLAGGSGNDTYKIRGGNQVNIIDTDPESNDIYDIGRDSLVNIFDNGGIDHINLKHIAFNDPQTKIRSVGLFDHLFIENSTSNTSIQIMHWKSSNHVIENINFSDGTYSFSSNLKELYFHPKFHGNVNNFDLLREGAPKEVLEPSFWPNVMRNTASMEIIKTIELSPDLQLTHKRSSLSIIVAPSVLDNKAVLLEDLNEIFVYLHDTLITHTVEYAGTAYNYGDLDPFITTVTRDGEFTQEFAQEIADFDAGAAGVSYQTAVQLIGQAQINDTLLYVAGADGSYIS